jgi:hypothetical protein
VSGDASGMQPLSRGSSGLRMWMALLEEEAVADATFQMDRVERRMTLRRRRTAFWKWFAGTEVTDESNGLP